MLIIMIHIGYLETTMKMHVTFTKANMIVTRTTHLHDKAQRVIEEHLF